MSDIKIVYLQPGKIIDVSECEKCQCHNNGLACDSSDACTVTSLPAVSKYQGVDYSVVSILCFICIHL